MIFHFKMVGLVAGVVVSCLVSVVLGQDDPPPSADTIGKAKKVPVYTVSEYDPGRSAADDLAATIKLARAENRRIILEIGGHWWGWCKLLDKFVHENEPVAAVLSRKYLIMKVNYSEENRNAEFLKAFPRVPAYPHYLVLESDGSFLHSQGTAELEEGRNYNEKVFLAFLNKWQPKQQLSQPAETKVGNVDAEEVLAAGLKRARREDKHVLIHLSAPTWGWCKVLEKFLQEMKANFDLDFVEVKIDQSEMQNGALVAKRLRKSRSGGIPWMVVLNAEGSELVSSDGPKGNCGYPLQPHEIDHFLHMLRSTSRRMSEQHFVKIRQALDQYRESRK